MTKFSGMSFEGMTGVYQLCMFFLNMAVTFPMFLKVASFIFYVLKSRVIYFLIVPGLFFPTTREVTPHIWPGLRSAAYAAAFLWHL